jgi:hypothetical protein
MNYAWQRADRMKLGPLIYHPLGDKVLVWIERAGDLHLRFHYHDRSDEIVRRDAPVMFQVCHRRCYERSAHHQAIDPGKAMLRVWRKYRARHHVG